MSGGDPMNKSFAFFARNPLAKGTGNSGGRSAS